MNQNVQQFMDESLKIKLENYRSSQKQFIIKHITGLVIKSNYKRLKITF